MNPAAANPAVSTDSPSPRSSPPAPQARTSSMRPAPDPRSPKPITTPNPRHPDHPHDTTTTHSPARPDRAGLIHTQTSLNGNDATMCKISDAQHLPRRPPMTLALSVPEPAHPASSPHAHTPDNPRRSGNPANPRPLTHPHNHHRPPETAPPPTGNDFSEQPRNPQAPTRLFKG